MRHATLLLRLVLLAVVGSSLAAEALAANWPRFRGPNGTGIALDKDVPVAFDAKTNVIWKIPIGLGNGSPIVWGDKIFLEAADDKQRMLVCINAADGKVLWSKSAPGSTFKALNKRNSLASSTPAADAERVYGYFWDGDKVAIHAFDHKGNPAWKYELGAYKSQHGAGNSPMVVDDKVVILHDHDDKTSEVVALDAKTGKLAWKASRRPERACYSTPFIQETSTGTQLIVGTTAGISGYDPKTGNEVWHWDWSFDGMRLRTVGSPIAGHGLVFQGSGDGSGARHMVAVKLGGAGDVTKTNLVWEDKKSFPYVPSMLLHGEHLYTVNDKGFASCHAAQTGKVAWTEERLGPMSASPILIDGKVYAGSEDGTVYVFEASPTFKLLAKNNLGDPIFATPAVADNRLYVRGKNTLYCIGKPAK